jgi:hypothetical protein
MIDRRELFRWIINTLIVISVLIAVMNIWLLTRQREVVVDTNALSRAVLSKLNLAPPSQPTVVYKQKVLGQREEDDVRPLLTDGYIGCDLDVITNPPLRNVAYIDRDRGIALEVPFHPAWGSDVFRVAPVEVDGEMIAFGMPYPNVHEGCRWMRDMELRYIPQRGARAAIQAIRKIADSEVNAISDASGKEVLMYHVDGLYREMFVEVVGEKHNYVLSSICMTSDECGEYMDDVIKSITFID